MRRVAWFFLAAFLVLVVARAALGERRVALVIGNSNYANVARLPNPAKDAGAIADALARLGFDLTRANGLGVGEMRKALAGFEDKAIGADWSTIPGGMEMGGKNWLVPVDATLVKVSDVAGEAVPLDRVQRVRPAYSLRIVILDACRNNPFLAKTGRARGGTRSLGLGLAPVDGHVALDGDGAHNAFAQAMLVVKAIATTGTYTIDRYSLNGFASALRKAEEACR